MNRYYTRIDVGLKYIFLLITMGDAKCQPIRIPEEWQLILDLVTLILKYLRVRFLPTIDFLYTYGECRVVFSIYLK